MAIEFVYAYETHNDDWDAMRLSFYRRIPVIKETATIVYIAQGTWDARWPGGKLDRNAPIRIRKAGLDKGTRAIGGGQSVYLLSPPEGVTVLEADEDVGVCGFAGWHNLNPKLG